MTDSIFEIEVMIGESEKEAYERVLGQYQRENKSLLGQAQLSDPKFLEELKKENKELKTFGI